MLLERLFRPRPAREAGKALYAAAVGQARKPALYRDLAAPDTAEGRFEVYSLHVMLLLDRLRHPTAAVDPVDTQEAAEVSQALFDTYLKDLDHALRELGVGDLSVGRKMRKLGVAFYGRGKSYDAAFAALPDEAALEALLVRTVYAGVAADAAPRLVAYVLAQRRALAAQPLADLLTGQVAWSAP